VVGIITLPRAIPPIASHFSVAWSVCLCVVCHIRAPCLNRLTDLDAILQVHFWGPMTHCVTWGPQPPGKGEIQGRISSQNMQLQVAAATWRIVTSSSSAVYQMSLVVVLIVCASSDVRKSALLSLIKKAREERPEVWDEYFHAVLLILLETITDDDVRTNTTAII